MWKDVCFKLKWTVHRSYIRPIIMHESEVWYLRKNEIVILRTEISMVRAFCAI